MADDRTRQVMALLNRWLDGEPVTVNDARWMLNVYREAVEGGVDHHQRPTPDHPPPPRCARRSLKNANPK